MENLNNMPNQTNWEDRFDKKFNFEECNCFDWSCEMKDIKQFISQAIAEERERAIKIVDSHLVTDWSGEQEVYEQLEEIINKLKTNE